MAFISGLMSGFSCPLQRMSYVTVFAVAWHNWFFLFLLSSLLFLVALYTDVRLSIELAGVEAMPENLLRQITAVRDIGTGCATLALFMFILATGLLGWLATGFVGVCSSTIAAVTLGTLWFIWQNINVISITVEKMQ